MAKLRDKIIPPTESPRNSGGWWYYFSPQWTNILEGLLLPLVENYRWDWNVGLDVEQAKDWVLDIIRVKDITVPDCPPTIIQDCPPFPDWIDWDGETLNINLEDCDVQINIFGCGCGCGENGTGGGIGVSGGGAGGSGGYLGSGGGGSQGSIYEGLPAGGGVTPSNAVTQCDFVTTSIPLILDQIKELVQTLDNTGAVFEDGLEALEQLTDVGSIAQDAIAFFGEIVQGVIAAGSGALLSMLLDNDFQFRFMEAWVKAHGSDGNITQVTYNDLNAITRYLPLTWVETGTVIFPRILFPLLFRVINYGKINSRLILAKNSADTELCSYVWAGAGDLYVAPPSQALLPYPGLGFTFDWGRRYDLTIAGLDGWSLQNSLWEEGFGVRGVTNSTAHDYQIILYNSFSTNLTGIRLTLDGAMNGDANSVRLGLSAGTTEILSTTAPNEIVIARALDYSPSTAIYLLLREWEYTNSPADNFTNHLQYIDLYGTGNPPPAGTPI